MHRRCDECNAELTVESSGVVRLEVPAPTFGESAALEDSGPTTGDFGGLSEEMASSESLEEGEEVLEEGLELDDPALGDSEPSEAGEPPPASDVLDDGGERRALWRSGVWPVWLAAGLVVVLGVTWYSERLSEGLQGPADAWVAQWSPKVAESEGVGDVASVEEAPVEPDELDGAKPEGISERALGHYLQGNRYLKQKKVSQAILEYRAALMLEPEFGLAYRSLGITNNLMGRSASAAAAYQRFVELEPSHPGVAQAQSFIRTHSSQ